MTDTYYLVQTPPESNERTFIGPFDGPDAEEEVHDFRLIYTPPYTGWYVTRQFIEGCKLIDPMKYIASIKGRS